MRAAICLTAPRNSLMTSGSSRSVMAVYPEMSEKITVTCRRSPEGAGAGAVSGASGAPQEAQKRLPAGFSLSHFAHFIAQSSSERTLSMKYTSCLGDRTRVGCSPVSDPQYNLNSPVECVTHQRDGRAVPRVEGPILNT